MANNDGRSGLLRAHVVLLGLGLEILDSVKVKGHELAVVVPPVPARGEKAQEFAVVVHANGKVAESEEVKKEVAAGIARLLDRRPPSDRDAVEVVGGGLVVKVRQATAAKAKGPSASKVKVEPAKGATESGGTSTADTE